MTHSVTSSLKQSIAILPQVIDPANLIDSKVVVNVYANAVAARRGNASQSTVSRYTSVSARTDANLIDRNITNTTTFDTLGNALTQTQDKYVTDSANLVVKVLHRDITNSNYTTRGDALNQAITTIQIDGTTPTTINYQEFTNRTFDSGHNCLNQMVLTYTDSTKATFLDCQEIRSTNFASSGVSRKSNDRNIL